MLVSFDDCVRELVVTDSTHRSLAEWEERIIRQPSEQSKYLQSEFIRKVRGFEHNVFFALTRLEVERTCDQTDHALGQLRKEQASRTIVEDFYTPFSLTFFFHDWLERHGRLPLWQEFWRDIHMGDYRRWYVDPLEEHCLKPRGTLTRDELRDATQWRLGKFYYSALREALLAATLRDAYSVQLKYHLFADLVLKVDGWTDSAILCVRLPNKWELRKHFPEQSCGFRVVAVPAPRPRSGGYGQLWIPENTAQIAEQLTGSKSC